jgi:hypothetical protein
MLTKEAKAFIIMMCCATRGPLRGGRLLFEELIDVGSSALPVHLDQGPSRPANDSAECKKSVEEETETPCRVDQNLRRAVSHHMKNHFFVHAAQRLFTIEPQLNLFLSFYFSLAMLPFLLTSTPAIHPSIHPTHPSSPIF